MYFATRERIKEKKNNTGTGNSYTKAEYLDLSVSKERPEVSHVIRLIGSSPVEYLEVTQFEKRLIDTVDEKTGKPRKKLDYSNKLAFPDIDVKPLFFRVGWDDSNPQMAEKYGQSPWKNYKHSTKYAQNVLERVIEKDENGKPKIVGSVVKVMNKTKSLFIDTIMAWEDQQYALEQASFDEGEEFVTNLGGPRSHDILLTVKFNHDQPTQPKFSISKVGKIKDITEEEIELLRSVGEPTQEELEEIYKFNPQAREVPEWYFYGYPLHKIYRPTPIKEAIVVSEPDVTESELNELDLTDDIPEVKETASKGKGKKPNSVFANVETKEDKEDLNDLDFNLGDDSPSKDDSDDALIDLP